MARLSAVFLFWNEGTAIPSPLKGERGLPDAARIGGSVMADDRESRAAWVRENLPGCAAVAEAFRAEFGDVRMVLHPGTMHHYPEVAR